MSKIKSLLREDISSDKIAFRNFARGHHSKQFADWLDSHFVGVPCLALNDGRDPFLSRPEKADINPAIGASPVKLRAPAGLFEVSLDQSLKPFPFQLLQ